MGALGGKHPPVMFWAGRRRLAGEARAAEACAAMVAIVCTAMLASACSGEIEGKAGPEAPPPRGGRDVRDCSETQIDETPIRLLTREEYNNTVRDVLGDDSSPLIDSPSADTGTFDNDAAALSISSSMARHYLETAEAIANRVMENPAAILPCTPSGDGRDCAGEFVRKVGRRLWRRPVPADEESALLSLYTAARTTADFNGAVKLLIQAMLNSPRFLYHIELGADQGGGIAALSDHELAAKLSYFIWNSAPDAELDAAADAGELHTPDQLRAQAERMFDAPAARESAADLHSQWLDLKTVYAVTKDLSIYREFTEEVRDDLVHETLSFLEEIVWNDEGSVSDIFAAPYTMLNGRLADFYGVKGATGEEFVRVPLPEGERLGLLTQGSLMAIHGKINRTSPVHRGIFVRHEILCETLPAAPEKVPALELIDPNLPVRERMKQHRDDPACSGCHELMDPVGFAFEHYDTVGRYRDIDEKGNAIDSSAQWLDISEDRPLRDFANAVEFSAALAEDPGVAECVSEQWYSYAMGRSDNQYDECTLDVLGEIAATGSVRDMVLSLVEQEVFRLRTVVEPAGGCE
jgi:hypothetical protein